MENSPIFSKSLNFQEDYPCPVCRIGKVSQMPMMESMYCDFCNEIFTINLELQQIKMPSREPALVWKWNGFKWTQSQLVGVDLGWGYGLAAMAFIILPTTLIGVTAYYFPPQSHVPLSWIPSIWTGLTFISHLAIIVWIFIEVYQIPFIAYWRGITRWRDELIR
ncbi:hypothetical protein FJR11_03950 [Anabaena sp. UHCC 0187]|uniref:hypothetical protein n=1 Tax=Anabaena sp. UHCC 0187 TaxID=2590018 RepID=UPI00144758A8|nr:hypothetical protein [Anabaena sp. UHCC 0187]MTJ11761.1 hypothetical protein [Anabaena sp. UHCC 0187]